MLTNSSLLKEHGYINGKWAEGSGDGILMHDAVTGEVIGKSTTDGLDIPEVLEITKRGILWASR